MDPKKSTNPKPKMTFQTLRYIKHKSRSCSFAFSGNLVGHYPL